MFSYLKDYVYYSELHDRLTIEECLRWENKKYSSGLEENAKEAQAIKEEYFQKVVIPLSLYFLKADRAVKKSETIKEWMKRDQEKDERLVSALEPKNIRCLGCSSLLTNCISRDLMDNHQGQEEVLFMFECGKCQKRRTFWESGKEWEYKPKCIQCRGEAVSESTKEGDVITTQYTCSQCRHVETDTMDLAKTSEEKVDPDFEANRKKYCIPEDEGRKIIRESQEMKELVYSWKERDEKKELYADIAKIQKLTIIELQSLLTPVIEKAGYTKLEFEKPTLEKDVILGFSLQDAQSDRGEYDSRHELQKFFKEALSPTNWRLMSDGVSYRLGFLQGRFRGIEDEEKLKELLESEQRKTVSKKVK